MSEKEESPFRRRFDFLGVIIFGVTSIVMAIVPSWPLTLFAALRLLTHSYPMTRKGDTTSKFFGTMGITLSLLSIIILGTFMILGMSLWNLF